MIRKREKERDADVARRAILAAAEAEFAEKGFSGARIDEIAARSGYNKSLIFQYFESKLGLYRQVIAFAKGDLEREVMEHVYNLIAKDAPLDARFVRDFVARSMGCSFDFMVARPALRRILTWEAAEGWTIYSGLTEVHTELQRKAAVAERFIQRAQAAGLIRADLDPAMLFVFVLNLALMYLATLPRFKFVFPQRDVDTPAARSELRAALIRLVQYGMLTPTCLGE